jgi:hypothetical protein
MSYKVVILRRAQKEMAELPAGDFERVRAEIESLAQKARDLMVVKSSQDARVGVFVPVITELSMRLMTDSVLSQSCTSARGAMCTDNFKQR